MKFRKWMWTIAVSLFAVLAMRVGMAAQDQTGEAQNHKPTHQKYKLVDLGTFGGPASYFTSGYDGIFNNNGTVSGWADTSTPDPYPGFCFTRDCFVAHAFGWHDGLLADLGALPGGASSQAFWTSANGLIIGDSQNGQIDPLVPGLPEVRAVLWKHGEIADLGTLEGGHESLSSAVNSRGQVAGFSGNDVTDPFSLFGIGVQTRAFLWTETTGMRDLGTLGGPDAIAALINEKGQIAGWSYTDSTPNPSTGVPTVDPFLWEDGSMLDLGTLGGTYSVVTGLNNWGQVVGQSNVAGDLTFHPFLWTKRRGLQDLGTLGGNTGTTNWINDAGEAVGKADLAGPSPQLHDAVLWKDGKTIDLGTVPGDSCSLAYYVNESSQVVGTSENQTLCSIPVGQHAFLWEHGGPMIDLNMLIPPGSGLQLTYAVAMNDRGEIAGFGVPPGCQPQNYGTCGHAYVLIPDGACDDECDARIAASQNNVAVTTQPSSVTSTTIRKGETEGSPINSLGYRFGRRSNLPGQRAVPLY
jgi:probable HAF family extracellular repeat protein